MSRCLPKFSWMLLTAVVAAQAPLPVAAAEAGSAMEECTIGVAAGRATEDGRPLLWKLRDAHKVDNVVLPLADGKVPYFALCDAGDAKAVWGGMNTAGFAIVNSVSRDLAQGSDKGPANGAFMKLALQTCTTVAEFETLLQSTNDNGRRTRANFAVIDAAGGAALFEAGHKTFTRFDADKDEAGVVVRTNFATTAEGGRGKERFARAAAILKTPAAKALSPRFVLQQVLRDVQAPPSAQAGERGRLDTRETICRQTTVAALVLHGVKAGEDAKWATMWVVLGHPLFQVAMPLFPAAGAVPMAVAGDPKSSLCDLARRLREPFFVDGAPAEKPEGEEAEEAEQAGGLQWLRTDTMPVVRRSILFAEAEVLALHAEAVANWKQALGKPVPPAMRAFQEAMARRIGAQLKELVDAHAGVGSGK
ncbi:MAG: hypothetical protein JNK15_06530 [Planctomycetes bacterium]|nr:hypothetical protein [Planctomycetota bacterium]